VIDFMGDIFVPALCFAAGFIAAYLMFATKEIK
jgi:hypothetical protein